MKKTSIKKFSLMVALIVCMLGSISAAEVKAKILVNGIPSECTLLWKASSQVYVVREGKVTREVSPDDIQKMVVAPPENWKNIQGNFAKGSNLASLIPLLTKIKNEYTMLEYDAKAGALVAQIYLKQGKPQEALKFCKSVVQSNKRAGYDSEMAPYYWQAMIESRQTTGLSKLLDSAVSSDNVSISAAALIARGDLLCSEDKQMAALKDGYLRVVFLYGSESKKQPEAIYKAYETFIKLGQTTNAEKMRNMILKNAKYRQTEWGKKLTEGK